MTTAHRSQEHDWYINVCLSSDDHRPHIMIAKWQIHTQQKVAHVKTHVIRTEKVDSKDERVYDSHK